MELPRERLHRREESPGSDRSGHEAEPEAPDRLHGQCLGNGLHGRRKGRRGSGGLPQGLQNRRRDPRFDPTLPYPPQPNGSHDLHDELPQGLGVQRYRDRPGQENWEPQDSGEPVHQPGDHHGEPRPAAGGGERAQRSRPDLPEDRLHPSPPDGAQQPGRHLSQPPRVRQGHRLRPRGGGARPGEQQPRRRRRDSGHLRPGLRKTGPPQGGDPSDTAIPGLLPGEGESYRDHAGEGVLGGSLRTGRPLQGGPGEP
ncbi:MAG: hypothetical protein BWY86_01514 [Candidatus Aminicenantes bacterium ADurb.Bin508]|nr:MAG: hypothetical protein BWY86_01514 [Candidatus Aminicenantes bacterium ADurb.Bin508]